MSSNKAFMDRARRCRREQAKAEQEQERAAGARVGSGSAAPGEIWSFVADYLRARAELWEARASRPARASQCGKRDREWGERIVLH
jgi:hypothetical protein